MKLKLVISLTGILMLYGFTMKPSTDTTTGKEDNRSWVLGPFVRPEGANPVISPQPTSFYCPMQKPQVKWEESYIQSGGYRERRENSRTLPGGR